jgi:Na+/H+ antiporter NhaD/arsenite permease-like protein
VIIGIAARNRTPISFWEFTRYGLVVTFVTVLASVPYFWVRYLI